jgi:CheY-like chemotaxis protein
MDKRATKTVLICDNDPDNSFTLQGELRNRNYEVITINDATELESSARSLRPVAVLANPDMKGFNEYDICKSIKNELNIPLLLLIDKNSTHRAGLNRGSTKTPDAGSCEADDVISKPVQVVENVINLIEKHMVFHQSNP